MAATATLPAALSARDRSARPNKWLVSISILFGGMMGAIDTSVVNVSLAHIQSSYGVTTQQVTWVSTSYLITLVIIMPLTAWVASVFGRKRMFMLSIAVFTLASLFCGLSRTLWQLILFRVLQGVGGGALQPVAQSIMRETFPPREQAQAMGMYAMIGMLGPALGPSLGGWITDNLSWPFIFFINIPIGIIGLFMAYQFIVDPPYMRAQGIRRIDPFGIGLMAIGLASLQVLLEEGETDGWFQSSLITALAVIAVVALVLFVIQELRSRQPAVDLRVLKNASFASGTIVIGVVGLALWGGMILMPLFFQELLGYDATRAGVTLIPRSLSMLLMMPIAGLLYNRLGVYVMLPCGLLLSGFAGLMMAQFNLNTGELQILVPQILQGIGFSLMFVSLSTSSLSNIPRPQMQSATGLYNLVRQLGGSLGTAIVITLVDHKMVLASANLTRYASFYNPQFMQWWKSLQEGFVARGTDPTTAHMRALATLQTWITQQSAVVAYDYAFAMIGIVFFACLPLVLFMRRGQRQPAGESAVAAAAAD